MTALPIDLPEGFIPLVKQGDTIRIGEILAKKDAPQDEVVNIMQALTVDRNGAKKVLKKSPGDKINPGDVIAVKKGAFGKVKGKITSQIAGTILRYERDTGNLVVRADIAPSSLELISPVAGTITLCNNREIRIETKDALVSNGIAIGSLGEGRLYTLKETFAKDGSDNSLYYLDSRAEGKIVFVHTISRDMIIKGDSIGAAGFLGIDIADTEIDYLQKSDVQIPVLEVSEELVSKLHEWENKRIMIDVGNKAIVLRE
jgi:hypothetical protein